jgi:hypothetical protein
MAITRTTTVTATFTRQWLIELQIDRVLARVGATSATSKGVLSGLAKKWIVEVSVYGLDAVGRCAAELLLKIDWDRNAFHLSAGRETVELDGSWEDGISVEVDRTLILFLEYVQEENLSSKIHVRYAPTVDEEAANRELGFVPAEPVTWRGGFVGTAMTVTDLDEFSVGVRLVDDVT